MVTLYFLSWTVAVFSCGFPFIYLVSRAITAYAIYPFPFTCCSGWCLGVIISARRLGWWWVCWKGSEMCTVHFFPLPHTYCVSTLTYKAPVIIFILTTTTNIKHIIHGEYHKIHKTSWRGNFSSEVLWVVALWYKPFQLISVTFVPEDTFNDLRQINQNVRLLCFSVKMYIVIYCKNIYTAKKIKEHIKKTHQIMIGKKSCWISTLI